MCTFCSDLPSVEKSANKTYKKNISLFMKPCVGDNDAYRLRLLWFKQTNKNDRSYPFIERHIHTHWGKGMTKAGKEFKMIDDFITCPSTKHTNAKNDPALGFYNIIHSFTDQKKQFTWDKICPMCKHAQELAPWNSPVHKDKMTSQKFNQIKRQYQAIIPVYVVNDPNNDKNNGELKALILNNPDDYKKLVALVKDEKAKAYAAGNSYDCFNGGVGVDIMIRMESVPELRNKGKANEYTAQVNKITNMRFTTQPYAIVNGDGNPIITKELIDGFEFDDQFYTKSTIEEINDFYQKYYTTKVANIPEENINMTETPKVAPVAPVVNVQNTNTVVEESVDTSTFDDLTTDPDDLPVTTNPLETPYGENESDSVEDVNIDDILDGI